MEDTGYHMHYLNTADRVWTMFYWHSAVVLIHIPQSFQVVGFFWGGFVDWFVFLVVFSPLSTDAIDSLLLFFQKHQQLPRLCLQIAINVEWPLPPCQQNLMWSLWLQTGSISNKRQAYRSSSPFLLICSFFFLFHFQHKRFSDRSAFINYSTLCC